FVGRCCRSRLLRTRLSAAAELVTALRLLRLTPATLLLLTTRCRRTATLTATQHLHGAANVYHDFGGVLLNAGLIGPFTRTQLTFNVDLRTFTQIFAGNFRQFAKQHNAVPFCLLFHLAGLLIT